MNIVILGAGAIGSLFGAMLSKDNNVLLIGRKPHVDAINDSGLNVKGKTNLTVTIEAFESVKDVYIIPDLLILAVKSYDTEPAIKSARSILRDNTIVMSLQNGIDNIENIQKIVKSEKIIPCITTHGVVFSKPGVINHTGMGRTIIGSLNENPKSVNTISSCLNESGIKTTVSNDIQKEIWIKAIINSSINPLTSIFSCMNGYLLENPILQKITQKICYESTNIANVTGLNFPSSEMFEKTRQVIQETSENRSSMLQSIMNNKKTEIDSINGKLVSIGIKHNLDVSLNEMLVYSVKSLGEN